MKKIIIIFLILTFKINCDQGINEILRSITIYEDKKNNTIPKGLKDALQIHIDKLNKKLKQEILNKSDQIQQIVNSIETKIQEHNEILKLKKGKKRKDLLIKNVQEIINLKNELYKNLKILKNEQIKEFFPKQILESCKRVTNQIAKIFNVPNNQTKSN